MELLMSNVSGIGDAYYWSVFKIAEAFGLHRDTVKKRLLAANTPVAATVRGNPVYALQHVGPALFSVKHEAADSVHDPSRTAQALTINRNEVNSTVDLTLTKQSGTGNRFVLQNSGNAELPFSVRVWGSSTRQNVFEVGTSAAYLFYAQKTSAGQLFDVNGAINCTTLNQSSDRDLKDDILVISDATKAIRKMNGYTYTLKENGMPYAGVIAQEVMEAIPEAVGSFTHYGEELQGPTVDGNELREETRYLNVDYAAVTGLLVQVARETDDRVTALEEENTTLRQNLATAGTRISTLENQVSELVALVRQLTGSEH